MLATIDPNVTVALFAFLTAFVTVVVPTMLRRMKRTERHTEDIKNALGEKNGNGDAMQMLARSLGNQMELMKWSDDHDRRDNERFAKVENALEGVSGQLSQATAAAASAAQAAASAVSTAATLAAGVASDLKAKEDAEKAG